jgi:hypothetical protein
MSIIPANSAANLHLGEVCFLDLWGLGCEFMGILQDEFLASRLLHLHFHLVWSPWDLFVSLGIYLCFGGSDPGKGKGWLSFEGWANVAKVFYTISFSLLALGFLCFGGSW